MIDTKAISTSAIIETVRSLKDKSLSLSVSTPELTSQEKAMFMDIQGMNVNLLIQPEMDNNAPEVIKVKNDLDQKPQSVRMRNVIYILWTKDPEGMTFEAYYKYRTEKIIDWLKRKIDE